MLALRLVVVLAGVAICAASTKAPQPTYTAAASRPCPEDWEQIGDGCAPVFGTPDAAVEQAASIIEMTLGVPPPPDPGRLDIVVESKPLKGIVVTAGPQGAFGWDLEITNDRKKRVSVVWDDSTYVSPKGIAGGRLVRGKTRKIDTANAQPPTPIPPGATQLEWCIPEDYIDLVDYAEIMDKAFAESSEAGRLSLVFRTDKGEETWEGAVMYTPPAIPPTEFHCAASVCARAPDGCRLRYQSGVKLGLIERADGTTCEPASGAVCLTAFRLADGVFVESCFVSADVCEAQHREAAKRPGDYTALTPCAEIR